MKSIVALIPFFNRDDVRVQLDGSTRTVEIAVRSQSNDPPVDAPNYRRKQQLVGRGDSVEQYWQIPKSLYDTFGADYPWTVEDVRTCPDAVRMPSQPPSFVPHVQVKLAHHQIVEGWLLHSYTCSMDHPDAPEEWSRLWQTLPLEPSYPTFSPIHADLFEATNAVLQSWIQQGWKITLDRGMIHVQSCALSGATLVDTMRKFPDPSYFSAGSSIEPCDYWFWCRSPDRQLFAWVGTRLSPCFLTGPAYHWLMRHAVCTTVPEPPEGDFVPEPLHVRCVHESIVSFSEPWFTIKRYKS